MFIACPIAYAIASGVTEFVTIKDIEENFNNGIKEITSLQTQIETLESKTNTLLDHVNADYIKLTSIQELLDASIAAADAIAFSFIFFDRFKEDITALDALCGDYLNQYGALVTGKRQLN